MIDTERKRTPISVGISFHNGEKWFKKTINSVLSQSLLPEEIIILDDGTNPGLNEYLEVLGTIRCPIPLRVYSVDINLDISDKYNSMIQLARHGWIQIIDQDDFLYPDFYLMTSEFLKDDTSVIAGSLRSNLRIISALGKIVGYFVKDGSCIKRKWPILGSFATRSGLIYNSKICKSTPFSSPTQNGTDIIHLDQMRAKGRLVYVPSAIVHYEIHENSYSKSKSRSITPKGVIYKFDSYVRFFFSRLLR